MSVRRDSANKVIVTAKRASARCGIALVTILSWLAISNHCAFSAIVTKKDTARSGCPFHSGPTPQKQSAGIQCCKILRAVVPTIEKSWLRNADFSDVSFYFGEFALSAKARNAPSLLVLDNGPPGTTSFAQLVGSMLAHAPPFRV
ncbi:MAG: hypothetical protein DME83_02775 [Verrucomicrobia bacterium]|nr:MAG: hypothetical protein DME81_07605 [Verrucomicrobiota bacterium]PYJ53317.1 MAG: hypothetical protein DME83_02775 [Verrucomicrobiota bacterium]